MEMTELLRACADGEMPEVWVRDIPNGADHNIGRVVTIKHNTTHSGFSGCSVSFPGLKYDLWFNDEHGTDKRRRYMSELGLVPA